MPNDVVPDEGVEKRVSDKRRYQFNLTAQTQAELRFVERRLGTTTETEAVRQAISIMAWLIELQEEGSTFAIKYPDGRIESLRIAPRAKSVRAEREDAPLVQAPEYRAS